jgi:hypothetical protein
MLEQATLRRRRRLSETRPYPLMVVMLNIYAAIAAVIVLRTVLVALGVTESIWMGRFVYGMTSRVTDIMELLPGATRQVVGPFTMIDISFIGVVLLIPLGVVAAGGTLRR